MLSLLSGSNVDTTESHRPVSISSLDHDTFNDLKIKLDLERKDIILKYSTYINVIYQSLEAKGVSAKKLSFNLLKLTAFDHNQVEQKEALLSTHQADLENAADLIDIFNLLSKRYASFLNYEIFEIIADEYKLDEGQEAFKYPQHLKTYIDKLKISEFLLVNPQLEKIVPPNSKILFLKIDSDSTARLSKLVDIKIRLAKILDIKSAALQLVDINEGCVEASFSIPTPVAEIIFNSLLVFNGEQVEQFQALQILSLRCNDYEFDFTNNYKQVEKM